MPTLRGDQTNSFDIKVGPASIWLGDGTWPLLAGVVVCFPIFMLQLVAGTLHVGPDGLRLTWAGRKLFIDARSMVRLEPFGAGPTALGLPSSETGIIVHRRDNGPVRIALGLGSSNALSTQTIVRVIRRIEQVIIGLDARAVGVHLEPRLARGGRGTADWVADLRAIGARSIPTMRVADVGSEELRSLLTGAQVDPDLRLAAAVALSARSPDEQAQVRVAAKAIGESKLRIAIESAADDDVDAITKALDTLSTKR